MNLNKKRFRTSENKSGLSSDETTFQYFEKNSVISGSYSGGSIVEGTLLGKRVADDKIELLYQCLTDSGELKAGESTGTLSINAGGLLEIRYDWQWLNGTRTGGESVYVEIPEE